MWYHQGLLKQNETVRRECAAQLLELIPKTDLDPILTADILTNARGCTQEPEAAARTIADIRDELRPKAICVMSAPNAFTPDGRPMSWPGNFPKQLESICEALDLPLLNPSRLVAERGGAFSLTSDLLHFTPQFLSLLGDEILALGLRALFVRASRMCLPKAPALST